MELWQYGILVAAGMIGGTINVMAGGGSILTVPVMIFLGLPGSVANGTNRIAVLAQDLTALVTFYRRGWSNLRLSLSLAACAFPGAMVGAWVGTSLSGELFNQILALVMLGVMILIFHGPKRSEDAVSSGRIKAGHALIAAAGFWGGFIQIGMGFIMMPILNRVMGFDLVSANVHKAFITAIYTIGALFIFAASGDIHWMIGAILAAGNAIGGYVGARLAIARGEALIKRVLAVAIVVMIIRLLIPA